MAWFEDDLTALAFCWRLQRADGVALGFTSHDRDLALEGLTYRAAPGMVPSAVERSTSLDGTAVDLRGALTSDLITADDIDAGRWDGARLELRAVDTTDPQSDPILLAKGELGAIESDGHGFSTELRGQARVLDRPIVEETSPECRAVLGDKRCRVDMAGRRPIARVTGTTGTQVSVDADLGADGLYAWGSLRFLDGENAGLSIQLLGSDAGSVELREEPWRTPAIGTMVELSHGCDKRLATCSARFANAANFRGEPHLPGNDLLVRYAR